MGKITLDSEEIARLCETAEGFVLDASAEESLCKCGFSSTIFTNDNGDVFTICTSGKVDRFISELAKVY